MEQTPTQAEISSSVFDFQHGNLGTVKRIVQRQQLKTRVKFLEQVIQSHQPLIKAMQVTTKAFQEGVKEGLNQAIKAEQEAQAACKSQSEAVQEPNINSVVPEEQLEAGRVKPLPIEECSAFDVLPVASNDLQRLLTP